MGRFGIGFNAQGQWTMYPGVVVTVDPSQLDIANQGPTGVVALIGSATGFFPPQEYSLFPQGAATPNQYLAPGSDLLVTVSFAQRPFAQLGFGPSQIYIVPCNPALAATLSLAGTPTTPTLDLTTLGWGAIFNQLTATTKAGTGTNQQVLILSLPTNNGLSSITETYNYLSTDPLSALVDQINNRSAIVKAVLTGTDAPVTLTAASDTPFTGGSDGTTTTNDWITAIGALSTLRVNAIHVASGDTAVWDALSAYCDTHRARGFIGSATTRNWNGIANRQAAMDALVQEAASVNDPRIMHCGLGMDGYPGKYASARYASLAGCLEPSVPMTFKFLDVDSLETRLSKDECGGETGLLLNGVSPPMPDAANAFTYRVSRGLSTWTGDSNLYRCEQSVLAACDALSQQLDDALQAYIGGEGNQGTLGRIAAAVKRILDLAILPTSAVRILSYDPNITVAFTSDTVVRVTARITPIAPINWIVCNLILLRTDIEISTSVNLAA